MRLRMAIKPIFAAKVRQVRAGSPLVEGHGRLRRWKMKTNLGMFR